jgi:hypothetical protein
MCEASCETDSPVAESPRTAEIKTDLYCLECGYNLRGLSGDPVRCPECGYRNPIGDVELPADQIRKQLREMETAPTISVAALLVLLPMAPCWVVLIADGALMGPGLECPTLATVVALFLLVVGVAQFRASCMERPGWLAALVRYQVVSLLLAGSLLAFIVIGVDFLSEPAWLWGRGARDPWACATGAVVFLAVAAGVLWGVRPVHRWLKAPMERLQRQVAVRIARDRIRREMSRRRRFRL